MSPPNVFVLAIDSLRADAVHGDQIETPNLDALARRGSIFDQCICTTTTTTPSFSSILTGCYPPKHGVRGLHGYRLSSSIRTMPEAFSAAGYNTYAEVTGPLLVETGVLRGFAEAHHRPAYRQPFFGWRDSVISSMRSYVEPWFMLLHIWEVHRPYRAPPDFKKRRDKPGYAAAVTATDDYLAPVFEGAGDDAIVVVTGDHGEDYAESAWDFQLVRAARKIRRTLRLSRWFKYLDNRLAGREIGHGFALYEHLVRVPLTISGPGVPQNLVSDQVRHIDLFPTLADLCDVEIPDGIDGRSLRPLMEGKSLSEQPAYIEAVGVKLEGDRIAGVRTPDWKLLRRGRAKPALYKLDGGQPADEKRNLYRRYPEVARRLESVLDEIASSPAVTESGMTSEEESVVEQHLRDLGYL